MRGGCPSTEALFSETECVRQKAQGACNWRRHLCSACDAFFTSSDNALIKSERENAIMGSSQQLKFHHALKYFELASQFLYCLYVWSCLTTALASSQHYHRSKVKPRNSRRAWWIAAVLSERHVGIRYGVCLHFSDRK